MDINTHMKMNVDKFWKMWHPVFEMHSNEYLESLAKTIDLAQRDIAVLRARRDDIRRDLENTEKQILEREQEIEGMVALWKRSPLGDKPVGDIAPLANVKSLNEAVSYILRVADRKMSPKDIRDRLEQWGYDTKKYETSLISTLHTVLKRFVASEKIEEIEEGPRRKSYKWIGKTTEQQAKK